MLTNSCVVSLEDCSRVLSGRRSINVLQFQLLTLRRNRKKNYTESLFPTPRSTPSPTFVPERLPLRRKLSFVEEPQPKKKAKWDCNTDFEVEDILDHYIDDDGIFSYNIKWKNWSRRYNSWETVKNLLCCNYALMKYFEKIRPYKRNIADLKREIWRGVFNRNPAVGKCWVNVSANNCFLFVDNYFVSTDALLQKIRSCQGSLISDEQMKADIIKYLTENGEDLMKLNMKELAVASTKIDVQLQYVLRCILAMNPVDPFMLNRAKHYMILQRIQKERMANLKELENWSREINQIERVTVEVENGVDFETKPLDFRYTSFWKWSPRVTLPPLAESGCSCQICDNSSKCCHRQFKTLFAYFRSGRIKVPFGNPIYECNRYCKCRAKCSNSVVQRGRQVKLGIFRTNTGCGWGVKALQKIPRGTFVCEYSGELITNEEAKIRERNYLPNRLSYIFDLDYNGEENVYCLDATYYGNVSRFINHSCDPNLMVYPTFISFRDPDIPRLAFFARRHIKRGEEIGFDYEMPDEDQLDVSTGDRTNFSTSKIGTSTPIKYKLSPHKTDNKIDCKCGAMNCRKYLFLGKML